MNLDQKSGYYNEETGNFPGFLFYLDRIMMPWNG